MMRGATMIVCMRMIERMGTRLVRSGVGLMDRRCDRNIVKQAAFAEPASAKCERDARREDAQQVNQGEDPPCAAPLVA